MHKRYVREIYTIYRYESVAVSDVMEKNTRLRFSSMPMILYLAQEQNIQLKLRIPDHWGTERSVTHCLSSTFHHCKQKGGVTKGAYERMCWSVWGCMRGWCVTVVWSLFGPLTNSFSRQKWHDNCPTITVRYSILWDNLDLVFLATEARWLFVYWQRHLDIAINDQNILRKLSSPTDHENLTL